MKKLENLDIASLLFLVLMVVAGYLILKLFTPYINIIIVSLIIVQVFHPVYKKLQEFTKNTGLSTFLIVILILLVVIIPLIVILFLTFNEIRDFSSSNSILNILGNLQVSINDTITNLNSLLKNIDVQIAKVDLRDVAVNVATSVKDQLLPITTQILSLSGEILFNFFLLLLCLIYFFPIYDRLPEIFSKVSPLDNQIDKLIFQRLRDTIAGVLKGSLIVALLQATAVLIPLLFLQVGAPILLWITMVLFSIVPVGSGVVWFPVGLAIIISGVSSGNSSQVLIGILLIIYSAIIINVIDTTFRPRLMKGAVNIHPLATIFSVLGGIYYFGILGIFYGPLIFVLFVTIMDLYNKRFTLKYNPDEEGITT